MDDLRAPADDGALDRLLAEAGSRYRAADLRDLIAGIAAAPMPLDDGWMDLVADAPTPALRQALRALLNGSASADPQARGAERAARLTALRGALEAQGLDGFVVPRGDEHQGEYVPRHAARLAWLTGFTGSAGLAVVLRDRAAIFIDGRYTLQVRAEVDTDLVETRHLTDEPPGRWIAEALPRGGRLGYDPWLHTRAGVETLAKACARAGGELVPAAHNLVDRVWADQPAPPISPIEPHDIAYAGQPAEDKRTEVAEAIKADGCGAAVLSAPDSLAWLLNIRGADVGHTPLPLGFAIVDADGSVQLFTDPRKLPARTLAHLGNQVVVAGRDRFEAALAALAGRKVMVDSGTAPDRVITCLEAAGAEPVVGDDPCALPKARKNPVELDGTRAAHRRDGAALTRFLHWLKTDVRPGADTELGASDRLEALRRDGERFRGLSFPTISGAGPNGAIVHYRVTPETDRPLEGGSLYLVDSGAQYLDGTTDVTRTVAIGTPAAEHRDRFTRVLKGHIAIATARFPKGTTGSQLDALARLPLWQAGLDYDHGTGHGVGSFLGVHEGPQRISKVGNRVALEPGMIVSNEPGYYKEGGYGIRIENLVCVVRAEDIDGAERDMLAFETLTLAPIDLDLVEPSLLTVEETAWLDAYHERVREALSAQLDGATADWLVYATRSVGEART